MESKKGLASGTEDSKSRAVSPSSTVFRPRSPFRTGRSGPSRASSSSHRATDQFNPDVLSEPISCVTRETFQEDCARHRFIVWAAVKRNSCTRMSPEDKLRCPLLRCNQHFPNHELMLRHLAGCDHLASGEYWCFDHMRIERFDDLKCKHCLGHPSKRRKVLSIAKNFFHSLGHRSKKGQALDFYPEEAPPSYDSLSLSRQLSDLTELPANHIVEADSTEITTLPSSMTTGVAAIDPQALLVPSVPELDSTSQSLAMFMQWDATQSMHDSGIPTLNPDDMALYSTSGRPSLQLNTSGLQGSRQPARLPPKPAPPASRSKNLSPSSSLRSTTSTNTTMSTSTSLISPVSNWSGAWSMGSGFNTGLTSPVDDTLADNPFGMSTDACNSFPDDIANSFLHDFYSELPADVPDTRGTGVVSSDPLLPSLDSVPSLNPPYDNNITFDDDDRLGSDDPEVLDSNICCSDTKSIVASACDALQVHVDESSLKILNVSGNVLAEQLRSMSAKSIAAAGLRSLRALLNGHTLSSAIDALCFIHLMYAFSMVLYEEHAFERSTHLFLQSLSYTHNFSPLERDVYHQMTSLIWQPPNISPALKRTLSRSAIVRGKQPELVSGGSSVLGVDALLSVALDFLDVLEISLILGRPPTSPEELSSELYARHLIDINSNIMKTPFLAAVSMAVQQLQGDYPDIPRLVENLMEVVGRVNSGMLLSVRRLEIELIQAGMGCINTLLFYESFAPDVRRLCDEMYKHHSSGTSTRAAYHSHSVSLIEAIMSIPDASGNPLPISDGVDDLDEFINGLASHYTQPRPPPLKTGTGMETDDLSMGLSGISSVSDHNLQIPSVTTTSPDDLDNWFADVPPETQAKEEQSTPQEDDAAAQRQKVAESDACCEECGYKPRGDPQWFKGSMAKHKKVMHSTAPKMYKCPFPGCTSQYKNRPDNLRQHQIEKQHFVDGDEVATRRPSKRKKTAAEDA